MVDHEQPELQESATSLVRALAGYTITLQELEDGLLARLANSQASGRPYMMMILASRVSLSDEFFFWGGRAAGEAGQLAGKAAGPKLC